MDLAGFEKVFRRFIIESPPSQPTEPPPKKEKSFVRYFEAAKDKHGNNAFIAHKGVATVTEVKPGGEVKAGFKKGDAKRGEVKRGDGGEKKRDGKTDFTPEEDEQLKAFKATNTSWKKIAAEMGRPLSQLKPRWHELEKEGNTAPTAGVNDAQANNTKEEEAGGGDSGKGQGRQRPTSGGPDWKNMTPSEKKAEGLRRKAEKEAAKGGKRAPEKEDKKKREILGADGTTALDKVGRRSDDDEARFTMQEWLTLQEDDMFGFGEIRCISDIMAKKPGQTWGRIAGKFFDRTGRRVHPLDIRDKFQGLAELQKQG